MVEENRGTPEPDKDEIVCPLSLKVGSVQNYRVTWRSRLDDNRGLWESRPQRGPDAFADLFYDQLKEIAGEDAKSFKFTHDEGKEARVKAIEMVNRGEIKAPRRNWDQNFGPQGGLPLEHLKQRYPGLYGIKTDKETEEELKDEHRAEEESRGRMAEAEDRIEDMVREQEEEEEIEAETAATEATYGVEGARTEVEMEAAPPGKVEIATHEMVVRAPDNSVEVQTPCIHWRDENNEMHTAYCVEHPITKQEIWIEEGTIEVNGLEITLKVQKEE